MTLGEHLEELRSRLMRALIGLAVGAILCYSFIDEIMGFLTSPVYAVYRLHGIEAKMVFLNPAEAFLTDLKVAVIVGVILSAPYSLTQIWGFVAAGLYANERRWVRRFAPASISLFFAGATFLLVIVSPLLLDFLLTYKRELRNYDIAPTWLLGSPEALQATDSDQAWPTSQPVPAFTEAPSSPPERVPWINLKDKTLHIRVGQDDYTFATLRQAGTHNQLQPMMRISEYILFILHLAVAFGIGFQVPVVVAFLATVGLASASQMAGLRRYIWFGMAIGAAFITPPDVTSMLMLLVPMAGLLEIGLLVARLIERNRRQAAQS